MIKTEKKVYNIHILYMLIKKTIETSIDLLNPNDIYNADIKSLITKILTERYVRRCMFSIYITEIVKILWLSDVYIVNDRLDGGAYVNVRFAVLGRVLTNGEILHGCVISEISKNPISSIIFAHHEYSNIVINMKDKITNILSIGDVVPIIVENTRYIPNQDKISVLGKPYTPSVYVSNTIVYSCKNSLAPDEIEKLNTLLSEIGIEVKKHTEIADNNQYKFFKSLMYPFKIKQKFNKSSLYSLHNLKKCKIDSKLISNIKKHKKFLVITSPKEEDVMNAVFYISSSGTEIDNIDSEIINGIDLYTILFDILNKYYMYMISIRGFINTYNLNNMKKLITYWRYCEKLKE